MESLDAEVLAKYENMKRTAKRRISRSLGIPDCHLGDRDDWCIVCLNPADYPSGTRCEVFWHNFGSIGDELVFEAIDCNARLTLRTIMREDIIEVRSCKNKDGVRAIEYAMTAQKADIVLDMIPRVPFTEADLMRTVRTRNKPIAEVLFSVHSMYFPKIIGQFISALTPEDVAWIDSAITAPGRKLILFLAANIDCHRYLDHVISISDLTVCDQRGRNALHTYLAADGNNKEIISLFLYYGININHPDNTGTTPYHVACAFGNQAIISLILSYA